MNIDDVYRRHAAEAERQARLARNALDRAAWLRVAQGWFGLLHKHPQSDDKAFNAQSKAGAPLRLGALTNGDRLGGILEQGMSER
jgi:hypothetical protein